MCDGVVKFSIRKKKVKSEDKNSTKREDMKTNGYT